MYKTLSLILILVLSVFIAACSQNESSIPNTEREDHNEEPNSTNTTEDNTEEDSEQIFSDTRIKLSLNNEEVIVRMYDNPTSREFLERLPLTLTFEEYGGFEKLSVLEEGLTTEGSPSGATPEAGDFGYYSPWTDINIYYEGWSYSPGLVLLGKVESGIERIEENNNDFTVNIEVVD